LDEQAFLAHVAARLPPDREVVSTLEALHASDLYLACACSGGDPVALEEFERRFMSQVGKWTAHLSPSPAFADELCQTLRERLLVATENSSPRIATYCATGPLAGWVRIAAVRTAYNILRAQSEERNATPIDDIPAPPTAASHDPELAFLKAQYRTEFHAAFESTLASLSASDRNMLRLHYVDGLTMDELAKFYRMHKSSVSRTLARVREGILRETRQQLAMRASIRDAEVASVIVLLRSQLDVSLPRLLAPQRRLRPANSA
jgi:RNA polymerase sigma-70 factor (ECF subfamily)